jgi:hypothetical protein
MKLTDKCVNEREEKNMKYLKLILVACFLFMVDLGYSEEISKAFMHNSESGEVIYTLQKGSTMRSKESFSTERAPQQDRLIYKYTSRGEGSYDKYKDIVWDVTAEMEEKGDFLYPLESIRVIKDKQGHIIVTYDKRYDYNKQKIYYTMSDDQGKIIKTKEFSIKGKAVDDDTLTSFLKTFVAHLNQYGYQTFYLLSSEPEIYKTTVKVIGPEVLDLPIGKINTIKLRLIPDLGQFGGLGPMIPPTFVWYAQQEPHDWLKYEGLETGILSAHIITYISKKEPAVK